MSEPPSPVAELKPRADADHDRLVAKLREILEDLETRAAGPISGFSLVVTLAGGKGAGLYSSGYRQLDMIGGLEVMKHRLLTGDYPAPEEPT